MRGLITAAVSRLKSNLPINVKDFGAVGDGVADDTAAIQAAIDFAIYSADPAIGEVYLPSGIYKTSDTIHIGYGTTFTQLTLSGAGSTYRGEDKFGGSAIKPTFSDRPAMAVQGARRSRLRGLALIGKNYDHIQAQDLGGSAATMDDTALAAWIDPALHTNANSRYAPYAGIAVDPYAGAAPATAYPAVSYPAEFGAVAQYGKAFSDTVFIEDCYIAGFVVGAVIQPGDADGNGDFVSFKDTVFEFVSYGVSVGNSQSRNVNLQTVGFRNVHTCLTNNKHGKQIGKFGGHISGSDFDRVIQVLDLAGGYCGPMVFDGCYGELVWKIGTQSQAARTYTISFNGGEFRFVDHPAVRGVPAMLAHGNFAMIGAALQIPSMVSVYGVKFDAAKIDSLDCSGVLASDARKLAQQGTGGALPLSTSLASDPTDDLQYLYEPGTARRGLAAAVGGGRAVPFNRAVRMFRSSETTAPQIGIAVPSGWAGVRDKASIPANIVGIAGTLDFTSLYAGVFPFGIAAGDVVQDDQTGTLFLVESMAGPVATVAALNNYRDAGAGNQFIEPVSVDAGNWYVFSGRIYGTSYPNYGTTTEGSPTITLVGRGDGYAGFLNADLAVGDYLYQGAWMPSYFPAGAKITAIDTAARTITMSANAIKAGADIPLHLWVRG